MMNAHPRCLFFPNPLHRVVTSELSDGGFAAFGLNFFSATFSSLYAATTFAYAVFVVVVLGVWLHTSSGYNTVSHGATREGGGSPATRPRGNGRPSPQSQA